MDLTIADDIKFAVMDFKADTPNMGTETDYFQKVIREFPAHRYTCKLDTTALRRGIKSRSVRAQLESVRGRLGLISLKIPEFSTLLGNMTGAVTVRVAANKGATQIELSVANGAIANAFRSGTCIQFGGSSKVYSVLYDADSVVGGNMTVNLTLPLLSSLAVNDVVTYNDIYFVMRQKADTRSYKISGTKKHTSEVLDLEEEI